MQPVIVRPRAHSKDALPSPNPFPQGRGFGAHGAEKFELVAGERRWRAAKFAGLTHLPAIVRTLSDEEAVEWGLMENIQRTDLNAMDRAHALKTMSDRFGLSQVEVASKLGMDRASVSNLVRLLELEPEVGELIAAGGLDASHGKALLAMKPGVDRISLAREAARNEWSVSKITSAVKRIASGAESGGGPVAGDDPRDASAAGRRAVIVDLERRLGQQLGTKVFIKANSSGEKGKIVIEYYGLDHFDGLVTRMGVK